MCALPSTYHDSGSDQSRPSAALACASAFSVTRALFDAAAAAEPPVAAGPVTICRVSIESWRSETLFGRSFCADSKHECACARSPFFQKQCARAFHASQSSGASLTARESAASASALYPAHASSARPLMYASRARADVARELSSSSSAATPLRTFCEPSSSICAFSPRTGEWKKSWISYSAVRSSVSASISDVNPAMSRASRRE